LPAVRFTSLGIVAGILRARSADAARSWTPRSRRRRTHAEHAARQHAAPAGRLRARTRFYDLAPWPGGHTLRRRGWINSNQWNRSSTAELIRRLGLDGDERFVRGQMDASAWAGPHGELVRLFATRTRADWCALLEGPTPASRRCSTRPRRPPSAHCLRGRSTTARTACCRPRLRHDFPQRLRVPPARCRNAAHQTRDVLRQARG